ncbi:MAG: flagellar hook-associated protein FlgL [Pseudomonadota bacterium]|nr:flagellar hook-associated protein FlgL [Pseudomonadota bacterium]
MSIRITDNMRYQTVVGNMFTIQRQYSEVMEKLASMKRINRISEDALGSSQLVDFKKTRADVADFLKNARDAETWLSMTETTLNSAQDLLVNAAELAVSQSSATANAATRRIAAQNVQALYDQLVSLANTKMGDRYLFAGSRTDSPPFTPEFQEARTDEPGAASGNVYSGKATKGGVYSGDGNKSFVLKIVEGGDEGTATYSLSTDGGKTWGPPSLPGDLAGTISLGDGLTIGFDAGTFAKGDVFYLNAYAPGYYRGNGEALAVSIGKNTSAVYNVSGEEVFTNRGKAGVDVFQVLADLKGALENNKPADIAAQIDRLSGAREQVTMAVAKSGATARRLEMAKNTLEGMDQGMTTMIADIEDADIAELATQVAAKQVALQACYEVASRIQNNTILNFLK